MKILVKNPTSVVVNQNVADIPRCLTYLMVGLFSYVLLHSIWIAFLYVPTEADSLYYHIPIAESFKSTVTHFTVPFCICRHHPINFKFFCPGTSKLSFCKSAACFSAFKYAGALGIGVLAKNIDCNGISSLFGKFF